MKLMRIGARGAERPLIQTEDGRVFDVSDIAPADEPFGSQEIVGGLRSALDRGAAPEIGPAAIEGLRRGSPLRRPGKIVCVGLNYRKHAQEAGMPEPAEPILFLKAADTVVGPDDDVTVPRNSTKTDYEVELGVVIGRTTRYLDSPTLDPVLGYVICDDVSEREFQLERGGQWDKGKNCETFNPLGPYLVTADEVGDPQTLGMTLSVNGEVRQASSTADMIFPVAELIHYISQFMTLYPGDVISTGTPQGVGSGFTPPRFLRAGDRVDIAIDRLGTQSHRFVDVAEHRA